MASVFKATYRTTDKKTGQPVVRKRRKWSIKYKNAAGKWIIVPGFRDKEATLTHARKLEKRAEHERVGIHDPFEEHRRTPLGQHIDEFERHLVAKGDSKRHVKKTTDRVRSVLVACQFDYLTELAGAAIESHIADRRERGDFGQVTSNYYLTAVKSFCRWLVRENRIPANPLGHITAITVDEENSRPRRVLTAVEFEKILKAARASTSRHQLPGPARAMLYLIASHTGFRASELASVTPSSFDLAAPSLTVEAAYSKRRRRDVQPLRADLASIVAEFLEGRAGDELIWPGTWQNKAALMLRIDLAAAGVPFADDRGRVADFHSLRHAYITLLHRAGAYGRVLQSLARHSTPTLTARYTHVELNDVQGALAGLPAITSSKPKRGKSRKQA